MTSVQAYREVVKELVEIFDRKNANYGDSAFIPPVFAPGVAIKTALMVRASDKVKRIASLLEGEPDKVGEATEDTVKDLVNYLIMWLACDLMKEETE